MIRLVVLLSLSLLAACGELPQPFRDNPGAQARLLAQPPPSRLRVPSPTQALLPSATADAWAGAVADALQEQEIPAAAGPPGRAKEWTLVLTAEVRGNQVVPSYTVLSPEGVSQGVSDGAPVSTADWANGNTAVLKAAAVQGAPGVVALLGRIEAARRQSDPNSLVNRPARVFVAGVSGAPGDGNTSLMTQMRLRLASNGLVVQDTEKDADFKLEGDIKTAPGVGGSVRVEIQWIVTDARAERGRILQINEVPPRAVNPYWGDTAVAVATEAAAGVRDVIGNATGTRVRPK